VVVDGAAVAGPAPAVGHLPRVMLLTREATRPFGKIDFDLLGLTWLAR
jgi:hypothetical protein